MMSPEKLSSEPPVTAKSPLQKFKEGLMNQDKNPSLGITPILESVAKSPLQKYKENNTPSSTSDQELVGKSPLQKFKESLSGIKLEADPKQLRSPDKALSSLENVKNEPEGTKEEPKTPEVKKEHKHQPYEEIVDSIYLSERKGLSKLKKEARRMVCDCTLPSREDYQMGSQPCGDDCLNRMLMIECGSRCPCGDLCTNKRFQKHQYAMVGVFETDYKGRGLEALEDTEAGTFLMEYVGEVLDYREFKKRTKKYDTDDKIHHYFMALNADQIIDATRKGSISRFINHSCDPNSETQKWTVNGQLRIGFFTTRDVKKGEELTFDYQFETYGKEAQKCYCGAANCRGYIGGNKTSPLKTDRKEKENKKKKRKELFDDVLDDEIDKMLALDGMKRKEHVLELSRLMVRAENPDHRLSLLKLIQDTKESACLRLFLDYHGLDLLWSWAVDMPPNAIDLKIDMLAILKMLPIANKTILKDSKIWNVVEKWSTQTIETPAPTTTTPAAIPTKDTANDTENKTSEATTPALNSDASGKPNDTSADEAVPHKKRRLFRMAGEKDVGSSSDGEASDSSHKDAKATIEESKKDENEVSSTNRLNETVEEAAAPDTSMDSLNEAGQGDNSVVGSTSQDEEPTEAEVGSQGDTQTMGMEKIKTMAIELMNSWNTLKEIFKIPKIRVEERKKTERELDRQYLDRGRDLHDRRLSKDRGRDRDRDRYDRKRHRDDSPDNRGIDKRHRHSDDRKERERSQEKGDDDSFKRRPRKNRDKLRILLPTPQKGPKLSKEEYRRRFEEQVKANDELAEHYKQMQEQAEAAAYQQYYTDPATGLMYPQDPNLAYQDPNMAYQDPNVAYQMKMQVDPVTGQMIQVPATETQSVDPTTGQLVSQQQQMVVAPDGQQMMIGPDGQQMMVGPDGQQMMIGPDGQYLPATQQPQQPMLLDAAGQPLPPPLPPPMESDQHMVSSSGQLDINNQQMLMQQQLVDSSMYEANEQPPVILDPNGQPIMSQHQHHQGPPILVDSSGQPIPAHQAMVDSTGQSVHQQQQHLMVDTSGQQVQQPQVVMDAAGQPVSQAQPMQAVQVQYVDPNQPQQVVQQTYMQQTQPVQQYVQTVQQQVYYTTTTPQGTQVVVQQPVIQVADPSQLQQLQQQLQQQVSTDAQVQDLPPPPPSPPPKPKQQKLPPNWKTAKDAEGKTYFYHTVTRQTQWDMPSFDETEPESLSGELDTPSAIVEEHHRKKSKKGTTTAAADTSSEVAKRMKDQFLSKISTHIISCLNPYTKKDCKIGRITNTHDFKYLARKLTHGVLAKEMKHCKHHEDLEVNENVKAKAKDYVRKYMGKYGAVYKKGETSSP